MKRAVSNLALIVAVGLLLFVAFEQLYTPNTAKIIAFGYFLLTLRLYELIEDVRGRFTPSTELTAA